MSKRNIWIAVGGSGGHLFPAQQLAKKLSSDSRVVFAGYLLAKNPFFAQSKEKIAFYEIISHPLQKGKLVQFLFAAIRGMIQTIRQMRRDPPDAVVGFGSYHTFPVLAAAWLLRKKLFLFEANTTFGKVNRFFRPFATRIGTQWPMAQKVPRARRVSLGIFPPAIEKKKARELLGFDLNRTTFLVFGGSQGASFLNEVIPKALSLWKDAQILHLTGRRGSASYLNDQCALVKEFETNMPLAYAAADLAICRAGAGTVAELIHYCKPALLIPYPHATDQHQSHNARFFQDDVKGGRSLAQNEATLERIQQELLRLLQERKNFETRLATWNKNQDKPIDFDRLIRESL